MSLSNMLHMCNMKITKQVSQMFHPTTRHLTNPIAFCFAYFTWDGAGTEFLIYFTVTVSPH